MPTVSCSTANVCKWPLQRGYPPDETALIFLCFVVLFDTSLLVAGQEESAGATLNWQKAWNTTKPADTRKQYSLLRTRFFEDSGHAAIGNFKRSNSAFLLATLINMHHNPDIPSGDWRSANLELPPFNFPTPERLIVEDHRLGNCLGMWPIEGLVAHQDSACDGGLGPKNIRR